MHYRIPPAEFAERFSVADVIDLLVMNDHETLDPAADKRTAWLIAHIYDLASGGKGNQPAADEYRQGRPWTETDAGDE